MKNFSQKLTVVILLLMCTTGLFAQQVIREYSRISPESTVKVRNHFDESRYTKTVDENGKKVYVQNQFVIQNVPDDVNNAENVTLSINLNFDPVEFQAPDIILIYDESGYINFGFYQGPDPIEISVPEGVYDVQAVFINTSSGRNHVIIKEQQNISENTTISLNPNEADNYVSINALDENGEILQPGVVNTNTGLPALVLFDCIIKFNITGVESGFSYMQDAPFSEDPVWNFYINNVSNRYSIIHSFIGEGYEQGDYFIKFETVMGIDTSVSIENNPNTWVFHTEAFQPSNLGGDGVYPGFSTSITFDGILLGGRTLYKTANVINPAEAFRGFLNNEFDDDSVQFLVSPGIVELSVIIDPSFPFEQGVFIKGNPVMADGNGEVLYGSGDSAFKVLYLPPLLGNDYYIIEDFKTQILPLHPKFVFSSGTTPNPIQGDNVPILISAVNVVPEVSNLLKYQYKGRYGENREIDFFATQTEVKQNGNVVFSGDYTEFISYVFPTSGNIEITLVDANTTIEGQDGINTTIITYNADEADASPTLQHLQFHDANDKVTSIFNSSEGASVRLAAGDFQYNLDDYYYDYVEGNTVEFYYSPYNQNNWAEIELTEYPEYFQMPAFGDYYEASLASVVVPQDNTWFDVKIICTDAAGNKQEQVISPAFKVEQSNMGTNEVNPSGLAVYPNPFTNEIKIKLPEYIKGNYDFKVSDITGKTIYSKSQHERSFVWNGSSLPKGVYILSIESNGKAIAKKVVKK